MPGYVIVNYDINDREAYQKYPPAVRPTLAPYGGKVLVADSNAQTKEGNPMQMVVVLEFESVDAAQRWYDSPEYTAIKGLRTSVTEGWLVIAGGFAVPSG